MLDEASVQDLQLCPCKVLLNLMVAFDYVLVLSHVWGICIRYKYEILVVHESKSLCNDQDSARYRYLMVT